ncbi:MAG: alpha-L-fucosidase [Lentisphaeria bacterium]
MEQQERLRWFQQSRFGIYIHYGLYSLLERGEWSMYSERIPPQEYARLAKHFLPRRDCAEHWADCIARSGAKYAVLTTRHHDGFCLFDSKCSDFTSVHCAAKRDIVAEYVTALRKAGLKVGLYYSLLDWRFPGYFAPDRFPESRQALLHQVHEQVRELMSNYGPIDLLEYDGGWDAKAKSDKESKIAFWRSRELNAMVRSLQPQIIINNRSGADEDIDTPEQMVKASDSGRCWESCMTMGDSCGWGYIRHNPNYKTTPQLLQHLCTAAQGEGNFLLNIGPEPDGRIRCEEQERLQAIAAWLRDNEESIRGSQRCELIGSSVVGEVDLNLQGGWTRKENIAYWQLFRWPGPVATQILVDTPVSKVSLLASGEEYPFEYDKKNGKLQIYNLPVNPPSPHVNVLKVEFNACPKRKVESDLTAWLNL